MFKCTIVDTCYISRGTGVGKLSNSKSDLRGHAGSVMLLPFHMHFPTSLPLSCPYLAPFPTYYQLFPRSKTDHVIWGTHMRKGDMLGTARTISRFYGMRSRCPTPRGGYVPRCWWCI